MAFLLVRTDVRGRRLATIVLLAMLFTPLYLQAAAWQAGFGVQGWYTLWIGGPPLVAGWRGAILIHAAAAIPWVVLIVGVGLLLAEPELEEEALLDGTPAQVFRRVTLRRAAESVAVAFLWVAVATAGEMTVTDLFLIRTYAEEIYTQFALGDTLAGATWSFLPSIVATAWIIAAGLFLTGRLIPADRFATQRGLHAFRLGRLRGAASALTLTIVGLLAVVPVASLAVKAGRTVTREGGVLVRGWSLEQFAAMTLGSPLRFAREFGWTALIGAAAATTAVAIALPLAWYARVAAAGALRRPGCWSPCASHCPDRWWAWA